MSLPGANFYRLNANDVIDILRVLNTGQFEYMRRIRSRMDALNWFENEIKRKEHHLRMLNNRIREFSYKGDIMPMTNSANELNYRPESINPPRPDEISIKPIPYV